MRKIMETHTENGSPFATPDYAADPYLFYDQLRTDAPVFKTTMPNGAEVYVVSRYVDVMAGLKDSRLIKNAFTARSVTPSDQPMSTGMMLKADPPEHTRLRALIHEAFKPKFVNQMRNDIQQIADQLLDAVEANGHMDQKNRKWGLKWA
jgi:cytochrome P450